MPSITFPFWYLQLISILVMLSAFALFFYYAVQLWGLTVEKIIEKWEMTAVFLEVARKRRIDRALKDAIREADR